MLFSRRRENLARVEGAIAKRSAGITKLAVVPVQTEVLAMVLME
jgi:hypothetical protein